MSKSLVIVESPAKAKTINKYLGPEFIVKSSIGHIRDLPTSGSGGVVDHKARAAADSITISVRFENVTALGAVEAIMNNHNMGMLHEWPLTGVSWVPRKLGQEAATCWWRRPRNRRTQSSQLPLAFSPFSR